MSELGGHVVDAQYFNPSCTHVIVGKASRNEKYLSSLAAGKWVLHVSYIEACREAGKFVDVSGYVRMYSIVYAIRVEVGGGGVG